MRDEKVLLEVAESEDELDRKMKEQKEQAKILLDEILESGEDTTNSSD